MARSAKKPKLTPPRKTKQAKPRAAPKRGEPGRDAGTPTSVAFLRGVNVGGNKVVPMARLQEALVASGFTAVKTIGHAGNILFDGGGEAPAALAARMAKSLQRELELSCEVIVRHLEQLSALAAAEPFGGVEEDDETVRYVAFLTREPSPLPRGPQRNDKEGLELLTAAGGDAVVVSRPVKTGRRGFPNLWVEKLFGLPATTRNWNTVVKLLQR